MGQPWAFWRDAWFNFAKTAFLFTPRVRFRGNHEDCSRAQRGFQLFVALGPVGSANDPCSTFSSQPGPKSLCRASAPPE